MPFCIGQVAYFSSSWAGNVWATIFPSRITKYQWRTWIVANQAKNYQVG
jgi:hypothetical protein